MWLGGISGNELGEGLVALGDIQQDALLPRKEPGPHSKLGNERSLLWESGSGLGWWLLRKGWSLGSPWLAKSQPQSLCLKHPWDHRVRGRGDNTKSKHPPEEVTGVGHSLRPWRGLQLQPPPAQGMFYPRISDTCQGSHPELQAGHKGHSAVPVLGAQAGEVLGSPELPAHRGWRPPEVLSSTEEPEHPGFKFSLGV